MTEASRCGVDESRWGVQLRYACELDRLGPELGARFVPSRLDTEGEAFLVASLKRKHRRSGLWAHRALTLFLSDFDANALLGMYPVFLFSTPQALALLDAARPSGLAQAKLLDVGAGSGDVTTRLAPLVESTQCTETSRLMARRLKKRGLPCWLGRVGEGVAGDPLASGTSDVIALLNVLDRASRPRALLAAAVASLPAGGVLLVSTPLPYEPFYFDGSLTRDPEERLEIHAEGWEEALVELWRHELEPLGLTLVKVTRLPYLSGGDAQYPAYVLDAAVLVCRKR